MKKLLISTAFLCCMGFSGQASAAVCDMVSCGSTVSECTSGTCKKCYSTTLCSCEFKAAGYGYCNSAKRTSCNVGENNLGSTLDNKKCCAWDRSCDDMTAEQKVELFEKALNERDFANIEVTEKAGAHYGWLNGVLKSPSNGRGNSDFAKLDICGGGHGTVDGWSNAQNCCDGTASNCGTNATTLCVNNFPGSCLRK